MVNILYHLQKKKIGHQIENSIFRKKRILSKANFKNSKIICSLSLLNYTNINQLCVLTFPCVAGTWAGTPSPVVHLKVVHTKLFSFIWHLLLYTENNGKQLTLQSTVFKETNTHATSGAFNKKHQHSDKKLQNK